MLVLFSSKLSSIIIMIVRIKNIAGEWKENGEEIEEAFLEFYKKLLGTEKHAIKHVSSSVIQEGNVVTEA